MTSRMIRVLLVALGLLSACVVLHAVGLTTAIRWLERMIATERRTNLQRLRLLVAVAGWTVLVHILEIAIWAAHYRLAGIFPTLDLALYFSAVTYTTTGYGDVVLPEGWRLLGGVEALTGILMCGWSTGFFFAVVNQVVARAPSRTPTSATS